MYICLLVLCAFVLLTSTISSAAGPLEGGVAPGRASEIAAVLKEQPFAFGANIDDRAAWEKLAHHSAFQSVIAQAEKKLAEPVPAMTEEIYAEYAKTGQRTKHYGDIRGNRYSRVALYTLAECLENKGRFIKPLEQIIVDICAEPTWIYNFHDSSALDDWHGKRLTVDLGSSALSNDLAQCLVVLGERLSHGTRELIRSNCRRRTLEPYVNAIAKGGARELWWINSDMNWNSVCTCGVVGTALAVAEKREERAWFIAAAEKFSRDYLRGFGPDGYCNEGMGYWNYGFSNYVALCELVYQATDGKVDLYELPNARAAAQYPTNLELQQGAYPSYADCALDSSPAERLSTFLSRHYRMSLARATATDLTTRDGSLAATLMYSFPNSATASPVASTALSASPLHSFFDHGGVLTCRPAAGASCKMAVSFKGGHNAEAHNHNDLGSFVVAIGKELLILDPGGEVYTARTFSKDRYKGNLLNSFGHPVPVISGKLQREGREAAAKILATDFTDRSDRLEMDITSAYAVPALKQLTRSFVYDRTGEGSLTVLDDVTFSSPQTYGTALLTYKKFEVQPDRSILIRGDSAAVLVSIDTGGAAYEVTQRTIEEQTHSGAKPTRIAIDLREPLSAGKVKMTIRPVPLR